jgi:hypothetical protein
MAVGGWSGVEPDEPTRERRHRDIRRRSGGEAVSSSNSVRNFVVRTLVYSVLASRVAQLTYVYSDEFVAKYLPPAMHSRTMIEPKLKHLNVANECVSPFNTQHFVVFPT